MEPSTVSFGQCFDVTVFQPGWHLATESLQKRRAWTVDTFPNKIDGVVKSLQENVDERTHLLESTNALWNNHYQAWFSRAAERLPTQELYSALMSYVEVLKRLAAQEQCQKELILELKVWMFMAFPFC